MKEIKIKSITLHNWRGEKNRTTEFNLAGSTTICGGNGLGKSRHFDAFMWLLFGKDCDDRKDFDVRTYDENHKVLHKCECSVTAELVVDGTLMVLKREYKEVWTTPSGTTEEKFKGNVTECTWDGVPVKVTDFQKRVKDELVDDTVFKMITNPAYFLGKMAWKKQREFLMNMAGTLTDRQVAGDDKQLCQLLDDLNGKSIDDFRKKISVEKKRYKEELDAIPARIDQTQKMMPECCNIPANEEAILSKQEELKKVRVKLIESANSVMTKILLQKGELTAKANNLKGDCESIEVKINNVIAKRKQDLDKDCYDKNAKRREIERKLSSAHSELSENNIEMGRTRSRINYIKSNIEICNRTLDQLRKEWKEIAGQQYDGSDTCPHCGQRLPEAMIDKAKDMFLAKKKEQIGINNVKGKEQKALLDSYTQELQDKEVELKKMVKLDEEIKSKIKEMNEELLATPIAVVKEDPETIPEVIELRKQQQAIREELKKIADHDKEYEDGEKKKLQEQLDKIEDDKRKLSESVKTLDDMLSAIREIANLKARGKELSQKISDLNKDEYLAQMFVRKKITECEKRINSMFTMVKFKMFDQTIDGNDVECCTPTIHGTGYGTANTASKLNAGLDVINTLTGFYNICAPIFVDNAESTNEYIKTKSQMIFLRATKDKKLLVINN